jgi:hypothetical protein
MHHLAIAKHFFDDYSRENSGSYAGKQIAMYSRKCDWIAKDLALHPWLTTEIQEKIKREFRSDVFELLDIQQKIHLLTPDQRTLIATLVDGLLAGEEIVFTDPNPATDATETINP